MYVCVYCIVIHIACAPRVINGDDVVLPVNEWHTYYDSDLNQCVVTICEVIMCMSMCVSLCVPVCICMCVSVWCVCVHMYVCVCVCLCW